MNRAALLIVTLPLFVGACASVPQPARVRAGGLRAHGRHPEPTYLYLPRGTPLDAFDTLAQAAGVDPYRIPLTGGMSPRIARLYRQQLEGAPLTVKGFGPRLALAQMLRRVELEGVEVPRDELIERVRRFQLIAVLRPDGYLASALTGNTLQRAGPLELRDGAFRVRRFELGRLYDMTGGVYRLLNDRLEWEDDRPLDEVMDDADVLNRALDGAQDAMVDMAAALGRLVTHPIQSIEDLGKLPRALAELIVNSPAYFERFRLMTRGEQIQALAKLTTQLLLTVGSAGGTTTRLGAAAGEVGSLSIPALSLSETGALAVSRVSVPAGRMVTALGGGPGALYVLHMANEAAKRAEAGKKWTPPVEGPGEWVEVNESMKLPARKFQCQVTGAPQGWAYRVKNVRLSDGELVPEVDFDGFKDGILIEAKGPGYKQFLNPDGTFWFQGVKRILRQAECQLAGAKGLPVHWYVAEPEVAASMRELLNRRGFKSIKVIHTQVLP